MAIHAQVRGDKLMRTIDTIAIHMSESQHGRGTTAADIHQWHLERGFDGIGYHAVILEDGTIEAGRPDYWVGAHVLGHNQTSLGVCMIGNGYYTPAQEEALLNYVIDKRKRYPGITKDRVLGHNEFPGVTKACPRYDVKNRVRARL